MRINDILKNDYSAYNTQITDNSSIQTGLLEDNSDSDVQQTETILEDTVNISDNGRQKARETKEEQARVEREREELLKQLENAREQGEAVADMMEKRMKCLLIASRIMGGDEVPVEDYRYLAENDLDLYSKAVSMRMEKENPNKHKRVSEDEESGGAENAGDSTDAKTAETKNVEAVAEVSAESSASADVE